MISVKVTYEVEPSFVVENKANINAFLTDFKKMQTSKFLYNVYLKKDGVTFVHLAMYDNAEMQAMVLITPSFLSFQQQRDERGLVGAPIMEELDHVGSSLGVIRS